LRLQSEKFDDNYYYSDDPSSFVTAHDSVALGFYAAVDDYGIEHGGLDAVADEAVETVGHEIVIVTIA